MYLQAELLEVRVKAGYAIVGFNYISKQGEPIYSRARIPLNRKFHTVSLAEWQSYGKIVPRPCFIECNTVRQQHDSSFLVTLTAVRRDKPLEVVLRVKDSQVIKSNPELAITVLLEGRKTDPPRRDRG